MIDVKLTQDAYGFFDISFANGQIESVNGFETAIYASLFTDARASSSQILDPGGRRGWLGNINYDNDRQLGGLLWLVDQRRLTQNTLNDAIDYAYKSLIWMREDGLVSDIEVEGDIVPREGIQLTVTIIAKKGAVSEYLINLWELTGY